MSILVLLEKLRNLLLKVVYTVDNHKIIPYLTVNIIHNGINYFIIFVTKYSIWVSSSRVLHCFTSDWSSILPHSHLIYILSFLKIYVFEDINLRINWDCSSPRLFFFCNNKGFSVIMIYICK